MTVTTDLLYVEHAAIYCYLSVTGQRLARFTVKAMIHLKSKLIRHH